MGKTAVATVPKDVLIAALREVMPILDGSCTDQFSDEAWEKLREKLGARHAHVSDTTLRRQSDNLRKKGLLGPANGGHGPRRYAPPEELAEYYETDDFKRRFEACKQQWGHRCALCYQRHTLTPYHRTIERIPRESQNDFLPLCKNCSKRVDAFRSKRVDAAYRQDQPIVFPKQTELFS